MEKEKILFYRVESARQNAPSFFVTQEKIPGLRSTHVAFILQHLPIVFTTGGKISIQNFVATVTEIEGAESEKHIHIAIFPPDGQWITNMDFGLMKQENFEFEILRIGATPEGQKVVTILFVIRNRELKLLRDWPYDRYGGTAMVKIGVYGRVPAVPQPGC